MSDTLSDTPDLTDEPLLRVNDIHMEFPVSGGFTRQSVKAVSGISLTVAQGETLGIVGESGCGKTTLGRVIVGLEQPTAGTIMVNGKVVASPRSTRWFGGLTPGIGRMSRKDKAQFHQTVQMMFQDPYSSLDPRMRVGDIIAEPLAIQGKRFLALQASETRGVVSRSNRVSEMLQEVGLSPTVASRYAHELSGGQRQRIGLARALALEPSLIVADEPVSALDVSIRSQILNLMNRLQKAHGLTYVVISHDLSVVKYIARRVAVIYLGKLVELCSSSELYEHPAHHYTKALLTSIPIPDPKVERGKTSEIPRGELPSSINPPSGCRFRTRCPAAQDRCTDEEPLLTEIAPGHSVACHFPLALTAAKASVKSPGETSADNS